MSNLEPELQALRESLMEMTDLVTQQMIKCRKALVKGNAQLAQEVTDDENRVNALELSIDKDCENILALYNPVAIDLRFVLASLKIGNDLERIGDNAKALSKFLSTNQTPKTRIFIAKFKVEEMFDAAIVMLTDMSAALKNNDTALAKKTLKKDEALNEIGKKANRIAVELLKQHPADAKIILRLVSFTRRLERIGDLIKNLGEEIVFHVEAKVIKHKKPKKD
jgi:phosphate transport system protein